MPRYKLTIEYAGTRYSGWQIQQNARTVQGELHKAIAEGLRIPKFETYGSGRTDAGVHALNQVAHLDLARPLPPLTIVSKVNDALPHDINVLSAAHMPPRFHARHSAVARSYLYQVSLRRSAFAKPYVWWVKDELDLAAMQSAARTFTGMSDFRAFTDDDPEEKSTKVLVDELRIERAGDSVLVRIVGSHFIWKMVRRLVGVLVEVGRGGLASDRMVELLSRDTGDVAKLTAPAAGLFLERVYYEGDARVETLAPAFMVR